MPVRFRASRLGFGGLGYWLNVFEGLFRGCRLCGSVETQQNLQEVETLLEEDKASSFRDWGFGFLICDFAFKPLSHSTMRRRQASLLRVCLPIALQASTSWQQYGRRV